jgi:hypothetical protein
MQKMISVSLINFAIHRDNYRDKFVSENNVIFCIFNFFEIGIAKNDIVFAYSNSSN